MASLAFKPFSFLRHSASAFCRYSSALSSSPPPSLEQSVRSAVESNTYRQIPDLLGTWRESTGNRNPFEFLSAFSESHRYHVIDGILQSLIPVRPHCHLRGVYSCLLSYTLGSPNPLPLALAIVQRALRSGCLPVPQTHLLLSNAWIERRRKFESVRNILLEMNSIGYSPDSGSCNYLILSLCKIGRLEEAVNVLRGMGRAGCIPDLDSYGALISGMSEQRMISEVIKLVMEMVGKHGLYPRRETVMKAVGAMCDNRDIWRAVEIIEFLENEGVCIVFEVYQLVLECCLESRQFVLAGKFVIRMTEKGFIPYIRERQRVFEGLVSVSELELASIVRQRFVKLKS